MYHLLIERISTVTIEFLQYRALVRIGLNREGIKRVVERTGLFTSLIPTSHLQVYQRKSVNYQPSLWSYDFVQSLKNDYAVIKHAHFSTPPPFISLSKVEKCLFNYKRQYLNNNKMKKNHQRRTLYINIYLKL